MRLAAAAGIDIKQTAKRHQATERTSRRRSHECAKRETGRMNPYQHEGDGSIAGGRSGVPWFEYSCTMDESIASGIAEFRSPTCSEFDTEQELLVTGWDNGVLTTQMLADMSTYSIVAAHPGAVKQVLPLIGVGTASLGASRLRIHSRGGMVLFSGAAMTKVEARKMESNMDIPSTPTGASTKRKPHSKSRTAATTGNDLSGYGHFECFALSDRFIVTGSNDGKVHSFDLSGGGRVEPRLLCKLTHGIQCMAPGQHHYRTLICGGTGGEVIVFDTRTRAPSAKMQAHTGPVVSLAVSGNTVITCGTVRQSEQAKMMHPHSKPKADPFVKVFDIRMNRQLAPVQCQQPMNFVRFLSTTSTRAVLAGEQGNMRFTTIDVADSVDEYAQVQSGGGTLTSVSVSSNGEALCMGDSMAHTHVWSNSESLMLGTTHELRANAVSQVGLYTGKLEPPPADKHPQPTALAHPSYWYDTTSTTTSAFFLKDVSPGMPSDFLLSGHKNDSKFAQRPIKARPAAVLNPKLLERVQQRDFIGYLENTESWNGNSLLYGTTNHTKAYADPDPRNAGTDGNHADAMAAAGRGRAARAGRSDSVASTGGWGVGGAFGVYMVPSRFRQPTIKSRMANSTVGNKKTGTTTAGGNGRGMSAFNFARYNKTRFAGLEAGMPNASSCNAVLQALYFVLPARAVLLDFLSDSKDCLATEAGFLFHMLDQSQTADSKVKSCQARNFLRTFRLSPQAQALGLIEPSPLAVGQRIGALLRFLLEHFVAADPQLKAQISAIFGSSMVHTNKWDAKGVRPTTRKSVSMVVDLSYAFTTNSGNNTSVSAGGDGGKEPRFGSMVERGLRQQRKNRLWCEELKSYQPVLQTSAVAKLAEVLVFNCAVAESEASFVSTSSSSSTCSGDDTDDPMHVWRLIDNGDSEQQQSSNKKDESGNEAPTHTQHGSFLPPFIRISSDGTRVTELYTAEEAVEAMTITNINPQEYELYELCTVISKVYDPSKVAFPPSSSSGYNPASPSNSPTKGSSNVPNTNTKNYAASSDSATVDADGKEHIVAHILIPPAYDTPNAPPLGWMLFNEFAVSPAAQHEVLGFADQHWRTPCVLMYRRASPPPSPLWDKITAERCPIPQQVFLSKSIASGTNHRNLSFTPLTLERLPGNGALVAIDCEFVALNTEKSDVQADGSRVVTEQAQLSLARVSCMTENGITFLDDHIVSPEPVVDYLTRFSGLMSGDLDPLTSTHHLLPLKTVYMKLRQLVDRGVVFVGHGLKNDFLVVNMYVPPSQIVDTVDLFHLEGRRMLSLSFLSSFLLGEHIQGDVHDSIEDARAALRLYKEYQRLVKAGEFDAKLREVYEQGRIRGWK